MLALAPFLGAIYFVLELAAQSGRESHRLGDLAWPILISIGVAAVLWLAAFALTGRAAKASVLASLGVVAFGVFGYVVQSVALYGGFDQWDVAPWVFLGLTEMLLLAALLVRSSKRRFYAAARFALVMTSLLVGFATLRILVHSLFAGTVSEPFSVALPPPRIVSGPRPDIYLILLDKYSGSRELAAFYDLDNSSFEEKLKERGFWVPRAPRANYVHTFLALAAMLNLRYLTDIPQRVGEGSMSRRPVDPLIERNRFMVSLKQYGYRLVFFPTSYPSTRRNRLADAQIPSPERVRPEFFAGWLSLTPIPLIHEYLCKLAGCRLDPVRFVPESADFIDWKLRQLERLPRGQDPMFIFLHLMVPHEPYIYDAECGHRTPYWPLTDDGPDSLRVISAYADQIRCVNRKLLHLIDVLQERSSVPPIILLQSDHGHGRLGRHLPSFQEAPPDRRAERASVLAAYAMPGAPGGRLPDSVTPINALRFVLREYFGDSLPPLEDVTYWSSDRQPYRFVRMSESDSAGTAIRAGGPAASPSIGGIE